jgi:Rrf2 family protein
MGKERMKISSRCDYALSCILRIADKHSERKPVTVGEIAEKEYMEMDYVEQLCVIMKRSGILKSVRGKAGGYILAKSPDRISAKNVIEAIDRNILEAVCFRKKGRRKKCIHLGNCNVRFLWDELRGRMDSLLAKYKIDELLKLRRKEKNWKK